jgi:RNA polymerase sigma factor (sigma-70 family)
LDIDRPDSVAAPLLALTQAGRLGDLSDADLLERSAIVEENPEVAEAALSALVRRHGPMVMGVCRTVVRDHHDSEDAFQATFLLLIRHARRLRVRETLGPWLHEVALRVCLSARRARARRDRLQTAAASRAASGRAAQPGPDANVERREAAERVHAEIDRLPPRLRSCVVLCELEGMTYAQAAQTLGVPLGTVQSRLARARTSLRKRLATLSQAGPRNEAADCGTPVAVIPDLVRRTVSLCALLAADPPTVPLNFSANITLMMKGASSMRIAPILPRLAWCLTLTLLIGGLSVYSQATRREPREEDPRDTPRGGFVALQRRLPPRDDSAPAPRELEAAGGSGKILVYELDREGKRQPGEPRRRSEVEPRRFKETEVELSWTVVTGVIPNRAILKDASVAVADSESLTRFYRRVELARQELANEGFWSEWRLVDAEPTLRILDNLPEEDEELVPPEFRLEQLVDPLPVRADGRWSRVNPERILIKSRLTEPRVVERYPGPKEQALAALRSDELMMRSFDFSVVPGRTYRYRARIVFRTPAAGRSWQNKAGGWSRPTEPVAVPRAAPARRERAQD